MPEQELGDGSRLAIPPGQSRLPRGKAAELAKLAKLFEVGKTYRKLWPSGHLFVFAPRVHAPHGLSEFTQKNGIHPGKHAGFKKCRRNPLDAQCKLDLLYFSDRKNIAQTGSRHGSAHTKGGGGGGGSCFPRRNC